MMIYNTVNAVLSSICYLWWILDSHLFLSTPITSVLYSLRWVLPTLNYAFSLFVFHLPSTSPHSTFLCMNGHRFIDYMKKNGGINIEEACSNTWGKQQCRYNPNNSDITVKGYGQIPMGAETTLTHTTATVDSVAVAINGRYFHQYASGMFYPPIIGLWLWDKS